MNPYHEDSKGKADTKNDAIANTLVQRWRHGGSHYGFEGGKVSQTEGGVSMRMVRAQKQDQVCVKGSLEKP